jgi:hypothetical protein
MGIKLDRIWRDLFRLPEQYYISGLVVGGAILFAPEWAATKIGFSDLRNQYRLYVWLEFLCCAALLIAAFLKWISEKAARFRRRRQLEGLLHELSLDEKLILQGFIWSDSQVLNLPSSNLAVQSLDRKGILRQTPQTMWGREQSYTISNWAWEYLRNRPFLIETGGEIQI